jgi:hypothetical protein
VKLTKPGQLRSFAAYPRASTDYSRVTMVRWDDVRRDFEPDGALRDIYVIGADAVVWDRALRFLMQAGTARYSIDDTEASLPERAADALQVWPERSPLLVVDREDIEYACHFFSTAQIELDFWPEDVEGAEAFEALERFVVGLGRVTDRTVLVTFEGSEAAEIFRYNPETDATEAGPLASRRTRG